MSEIPDVRHNAAERRFEIDTPEGTALLAYSERDGIMDLVHTEVPNEFEGRGYGAALARAALDHARERGMKVIPSCRFVSTYLHRHPEYGSLVATG